MDVGNMALPAGGRAETYLSFLRAYGVQFIYGGGASLLHLLAVCGFTVLLAVMPNPLRCMKYFQPNFLWLVGTVGVFVYAIWKLNNYSEFLYFQF